MYKELAKYYDLIYSWKNYEEEVEKIKELIKKYKNSDGTSLLDVGCGTGKHIEYLISDFSCVGIDLNDEMVAVAKQNIKDAKFTQADMIDFDLKSKYDVILCMFSSIGYVKTYSNLTRTITNFSNHLEKGGVLIIEPWFTKSTYMVGFPGMTIYDGEDIKIARLNTTKLEDELSVMEMHYLIVERNEDVKYFVDRHELGLFEIEKFLNIMTKAGIKAEFLKEGLMKNRGLYVGIKT